MDDNKNSLNSKQKLIECTKEQKWKGRKWISWDSSTANLSKNLPKRLQDTALHTFFWDQAYQIIFSLINLQSNKIIWSLLV